MAGVMVLAAALASCTDNRSRPENSELRVDAPAPDAPVAAAPDRRPAELAQPVAPPGGAGRRYQVAVETAYFFDKPEQSTPNGRYLRRGDAFYSEGEVNGFVKTTYVQPNGAAASAWLKAAELRPLPATADHASRAGLPRPPAAAPAYARRLPAEAAVPVAIAGTRRAVVAVDRSYFYDSPDLRVPRRAFCQRGDKVRVLQASGPAVYVTFTNWEKVTTTGWMQQAALRPL